jgi:nitroreductase
MIPGSKSRNAENPVDPLFLNRWSSRALSGEALPEKELMSLFEAARWAPSASNNQPWRILYARRETPQWAPFFNLLADGNKKWAGKAAVLLVWISKKTFDSTGKPSVTHSFDAGAAWENLALQASLMEIVAHAMEGFDYERARKELSIPDGFQVEAMVALGRPGKKEDLPPELQKREEPNQRRALKETICEGPFNLAAP